MTTTPVPSAAGAAPAAQPIDTQRREYLPDAFAHPDPTDRIAGAARPSFAQTMSTRSTEFKNALIAGGVGVAVAFLAAGFGLGYWAGDAGSSSTPQPGFSQMGGSQMGGGQMGPGQMGGGQMGSGQMGSDQNGFPGGSFGGQSQSGTGTGTGSGAGTGSTTS